MKRKFIIALVTTLAILALGAGLAFSWNVGGSLIAPVQRSVGDPPGDLHAERVDWVSSGGHRVYGWFVKGTPGQGVVLLLHALRADRRSMVGRARFLNRAGYAILLIDLQAHGENPGRHITFGLTESRDARIAVDYLKTRLPGERIGIIGASLGGAAALLGEKPLAVQGLVLEAVYTSLGEAVENRLALRFGEAGRYLAPLLLWQIKLRMDIDPERLSPVDYMGDITQPVFIIAGEKDRHTTLAQSQALFERAPDPKVLWVIEGARHVNFHRHAGTVYEDRVLRFFKKQLRWTPK